MDASCTGQNDLEEHCCRTLKINLLFWMVESNFQLHFAELLKCEVQMNRVVSEALQLRVCFPFGSHVLPRVVF